jgi:DNA-binding transcriptional LysR family regulator
MVYTPGTTYGMQIAAMLDRHRIHIQESPVCESASAEALLAQVKAGLGSAWIPEILFRGSKVKRCAVPSFFDIPYKILLIKPPQDRNAG